MSNICFIHDWLYKMRGGEKVLEAMSELYPDAPIYTLFSDPEALSENLKKRKIINSWLQFIPGIKHIYRWLLPLFPWIIQQFDLSGYDLIISSSHCVAKGAKIPMMSKHICYCHTPMRYLWGMVSEYFSKYPFFLQWLIELYFKWLRKWDYETSQRVDQFIDNSNHIAKKIKTIYGKDSVVIHPPVHVEIPEQTEVDDEEENEFYLIVSALVPYKRIDLAISAFNQLKKPWVIVGDGPMKNELKNMIETELIVMTGWIEDKSLFEFYRKAKALIFPGEEDFGMVPVEAQMFGVPVIAYGSGGILDSVIPYTDNGAQTKTYTGIFFAEQTEKALIEAVKKFENLLFDSADIQSHAQNFSKKRFQQAISSLINEKDFVR